MDTIDPQFIPPHCPNRPCTYFQPGNTLKWFSCSGFHTSKAHGRVQRWICKGCRKSFSRQTFDLHYWGKRRIPWEKINQMVDQCASDRSKARELQVAPTTLANKIHRLSKFSLARHHNLVKDLIPSGSYCADGFETFTQSQYYPGHLNLLVNSQGEFAVNWDYTTIRRKGRMTEAQKLRREELEKKWKVEPRALSKSFSRAVVDPLRRHSEDSRLILVTDEHPTYPGVLKRDKVVASLFEKERYVHIKVSSKVSRTRDNPLFAVNYMDRELRKDLSSHVRETTRFAREPNHMMDRVNIYLVRHNLHKHHRIGVKKSEITWHWAVAGYEEEQVRKGLEGKFLRRPFRNQDMNQAFLRMWDREIPSPSTTTRDGTAGFWGDRVRKVYTKLSRQ